MVGLFDEAHNSRMLTAPGHGLGEFQYSSKRIQDAAVPVLFQYTPDPFNRIVFAVVGRIVGEVSMNLKGINELSHALHELGAAAVVFRTIVLVDEQGLDPGKACSHQRPEITQAIDNEIAGDPACREVQIEFPVLGQEDAIRRHLFIRFEIVVKGSDFHPRLPPAREPTNWDHGFGVQ